MCGWLNIGWFNYASLVLENSPNILISHITSNENQGSNDNTGCAIG